MLKATPRAVETESEQQLFLEALSFTRVSAGSKQSSLSLPKMFRQTSEFTGRCFNGCFQSWQ